MRATLAEPALARYAGRFVWLELDYDKPVNQPFLQSQGCSFTPTLFIIDPNNGSALASHVGGLSPADLEGFLAVGEMRFRGEHVSPADSLLAHADILLSREDNEHALAEATRALELGGPKWAERGHAYHTLAWAQMHSRQAQACAETAATAAPDLPRDDHFGAILVAAILCTSGGRGSDWARSDFAKLEPLAEEALKLASVTRDHRFQIFQNLMNATASLGDTTAKRRWGHRWLDDIEAVTPRDDDERSALDIARVDAAGDLGEPERVLPALFASEKAMPTNYNASLRLAEMLYAAKRYQETLVACDRGLTHVTGPLGRSWLLSTKADAYDDMGDPAKAKALLAEALEVAKQIGVARMRNSNVSRLTRALSAYDEKTHS